MAMDILTTGLISKVKNGTLTVTRPATGATLVGPVDCYIGPPPTANADYQLMQEAGFNSKFPPTDSLLFNVPNTLVPPLEFKAGDIFTVTAAGQKNGTYAFVYRPNPTNPFFGGPSQVRAYVRNQKAQA